MTLLIIYFCLAIGISFFCSILEAVLLSITPAFVARCLKDNPKRGQKIEKVRNKLDQSISSILILNTFAHTMGAAGVGAQAMIVFGPEQEAFIALLLTLAILYLSEIIPKTIGANYWRQLAGTAAFCIHILTKLVFPLVWLSSCLTQLFSKKDKDKISRGEVLAFASLSHKSGDMVSQENQLIENILNLRDVKAEDILTPRSMVHALEQNLTVTDALTAEKTANFTRIPIYEHSIDKITGCILKAHLFENKFKGKGDSLLKEIAVPIYRVSESFPALNLLDVFIKRQDHIFCVEDHYGQVAGIVTLEDVIETLLGREIIDESDQVEDLQLLAKSQYRERLRNQTKK